MEKDFATTGNKSGLKREDFQKEVQGKQTDLFILRNDLGMEVAATNYGCALLAIMVPDKNGHYANVLLGHDSLEHVMNSPEPFLSTTIGRYGNRIAKGRFTLLGQEHKLTVNNGPNSLHGGPTGFHARVWDAVQVSERKVEFTYRSADGEEGFPGNLDVKMTYELENHVNALRIRYEATTDKATPLNLTNHAFFNLRGIGTPTPTVEEHDLYVNADYYVPIDQNSIPTGEILSVADTPMDFTVPHRIGEGINSDFEQVVTGAGYDHCYVLNKTEYAMCSFAASCHDPQSGRVLDVYTTEPGLQIYTGNWLNGFEGAHGATFPRRSGICFEAQCFPDTPNKAHFPPCVLFPGVEYLQITSYVFSVEDEEQTVNPS